jgi:hypothetical protein
MASADPVGPMKGDDVQENEEVFPEEQLAWHLATRGDAEAGYVGPFLAQMAASILASPQEHLDALVKAGVLEHAPCLGEPHRGYRVPQPAHEHDWRLNLGSADRRRLYCVGKGYCPQIREARMEAEIPTEQWPEYRGAVTNL